MQGLSPEEIQAWLNSVQEAVDEFDKRTPSEIGLGTGVRVEIAVGENRSKISGSVTNTSSLSSLSNNHGRDGLLSTSSFFRSLGNFTPVPSLRSLAAKQAGNGTYDESTEDEKAYLTDLQPILLKRSSPWPVPLSLVYSTTDIEGRLLFLYTLFPMLPLVLYDRHHQPFSDHDTRAIMDDVKRFGEYRKEYMEAKDKRDKARREARKKAKDEGKTKEDTKNTVPGTTVPSFSSASSSSSSTASNPSLHASSTTSTSSRPYANETLDFDPNFDDDIHDNEIPSLTTKTPEEIEDEKIKELEERAKLPMIPRLFRIQFHDPTGLTVFVERAGEPTSSSSSSATEPTVTEKATMFLQKKKDSSPYFKPTVAVTGILPNGFANPLPRHDMSAIMYDYEEHPYGTNDDDDKDNDIDNHKDRLTKPSFFSFASFRSTKKPSVPPLKVSGVSFVGLLVPLPAALGDEAPIIALKFWKRLGHDRFSVRNSPFDYALCTDGLIVIAFQRNPEKLTPWLLGRPALMYQVPDADPVLHSLKQTVPDITVTRTLTDSNQGYLYSFEGPAFTGLSPLSSSENGKTSTAEDGTVTYPGPLVVLAAPKSTKWTRIITYGILMLCFVILIGGIMGMFSSPTARKMISDIYASFNGMVRRWSRGNGWKNPPRERPPSPYQQRKV